MNCDTCGTPIDRQDTERGSCTHCGAVLAHVIRAAEKAELVRRVVAQGHAVRIEGDRIEAGAPPGPRRDGPEGAIYEARPLPLGVAAALGLTLAVALYVYFAAVRRVEPQPPPVPATAAIAEPMHPAIAPRSANNEQPATTPSAATNEVNAVPPKPTSARAPGPALPRTVDGIVAAHKAQYDRCQREELGRNPAAARRYSVAVTVDPDGRAEWVELLSEASPAMKSCVQTITRGLDFPKPSAGSTRSIITLSFTGTP
jgi:hypothetical protein